MGATLALPDKKGDAKFSVEPASSYPAKQTNDGVTVAVAAYDTEELAHTAFGKLNPNQYGVLPVLVVIQNDTDKVMKLGSIEVEYTDPGGGRVSATPAYDVQTLGGGARRPSMPNGSPLPRKKLKSPMNEVEIETRSFAAKMLPAHDSAHGFFYFQISHRPGSKFYLTGIKEAASGKDLFFFEIPMK
jgi:hypothetical protein